MMELAEVFFLDQSHKWYSSFQAKVFFIPNIFLELHPVSVPLIKNQSDFPFSCTGDIFIQLEQIKAVEIEKSILYLKINVTTVALSFNKSQYMEKFVSQLQLYLEARDIKEEKEFNFNSLLTQFIQKKQQCKSKEELENIHLSFLQNLLKEKNDLEKNEFNIFTFVKNYILNSNQQIFEMLLNDKCFPTLLQCLSKDSIYKNIKVNFNADFQNIKLNKIRQFQHPSINRPYQLIIKANYLKNHALCIYLEANNEKIFLSTFKSNALKVIEAIQSIPDLLKNLITFAPQIYLNVYSQIWGLFKIIDFTAENLFLRDNFYQLNRQLKLHAYGVKCLETILTKIKKIPQEKTYQAQIIEEKYFQKWLQVYEFIMKEDLKKFQQLFLTQEIMTFQNEFFNIFSVLMQIFNKSHYHGRNNILKFITNFLKMSNQRQKNQHLMNLFFNNLIQKILQQKLQDFILKSCCIWYKIESNRMRRILIKFKILEKLNLRNKSIIIYAIKLLIVFKQSDNKHIFEYLQNSQAFRELRLQYKMSNIKKNSLIYSLFCNLFFNLYKSNSIEKTFFIDLFQPDQIL